MKKTPKNILGGQTGGNLICWGEMFPTTPNMFLSNNTHKNSIFDAFFQILSAGRPSFTALAFFQTGLAATFKAPKLPTTPNQKCTQSVF